MGPPITWSNSCLSIPINTKANAGSYMNTHVLLNLLNELEKREKL